MDMDRIARRVSERLAAEPSRRGFVAAVAKLGIVAGAVVAGLRGLGQAAAQEYPLIPGSCCRGPYDCGSGRKCPAGTRKSWQWFCQLSDGTRQRCVDCNDAEGLECVAVS